MEDPERTKRIEMRIKADGVLKNPVMLEKSALTVSRCYCLTEFIGSTL
jgi:hypothetical protein